MGEENLEVLMKNQKPANTYKLFENWVAKQPLPVEAAVNTVMGAVYGGAFGFAVNGLFRRVCSFPKVPSWHMALIQATFLGVDDGITCVMKRLRGKEDIQTRLAAGFGCGAMASLASRVRGCHAFPGVIPLGVATALANGGLFKLEEKSVAYLERIIEKGSLTEGEGDEGKFEA